MQKYLLLLIALLIVSVPGLAQRTGNPGTGGAIGQGVIPVLALPPTCTAVGSATSSSPVRYQGYVYICSATNTWTQAGTGGGSITGLTATRVPVAASGTTLVDYAGFTHDGTTLTVAGLKDSGLTSGRVPFATTGGLLTDSASLAWDSGLSRFTIDTNGTGGGLYFKSYGVASASLSIGATYVALAATNSLGFAFQASSNNYLTIASTGLIAIGSNLTPATAQLTIVPNSSGIIGQIIKLAASQSADALQVQNSSGNVEVGIGSGGGIYWTANAGGSASIGAAVRYIGFGGTSDSLYINVPTGGAHYWAVNETTSAALTAVGFTLSVSNYIRWGSSGISSPDTGIARNAAGVLEINSGTVGTFRDLLARKISINNACVVSSGAGSPEGVVTGNVCDLFLRTDGSTSTTLYVKTSGTGNTGWTAK